MDKISKNQIKIKTIYNYIKIIDNLNKNPFKDVEIFIVGGFLRDFFFKKISDDIDFALSKKTKDFALEFAKKIKGAFIILDEETKSFRVVKKINSKKNLCFDFTEFRGEKNNIISDLKQRDFTINAIAISLENFIKTLNSNIFEIKNNSLIDPCLGKEDINNKTIKKVSNLIFDDDPLRLLRCFRIAIKNNFKIDPETKNLIYKESNLINKSSKERIHDEIIKIFSSNKNIFNSILEMDKNLLIENIFGDEISFLKKQIKFYYHEDGLYGHLLETLFCFEFIIKHLNKIFNTESDLDKKIIKIFKKYLKNNLAGLKLLCLFHDIGKPECLSISNEKIHFFKHDEVSATKIEPILKNLKFSNKEINFIKNSTLFHMQAGNLAKTNEISDKASYRFFKRTENIGIGILLFTLADVLASIRGAKNISYKQKISIKEFHAYEDFTRCCDFIKKILSWYIKDKEKTKIDRFLNGNEIMKLFNLQPSKKIGEILDILDEKQNLGEIKTKKNAIKEIQNFLENNKNV